MNIFNRSVRFLKYDFGSVFGSVFGLVLRKTAVFGSVFLKPWFSIQCLVFYRLMFSVNTVGIVK